MTKVTLYVCDVCGAQHDEPFGFHIIIEKRDIGRRIADVYSQECATKFVTNETVGLPVKPCRKHHG